MKRSNETASNWGWSDVLAVGLYLLVVLALYWLVLRFFWGWFTELSEPVKVGIVGIVTAIVVKAFERLSRTTPVPAALQEDRADLYRLILDEIRADSPTAAEEPIQQSLVNHRARIALIGGPAVLSLAHAGTPRQAIEIDQAGLIMAFRSDLGMELPKKGSETIRRWLHLSTEDSPASPAPNDTARPQP